MIGLFNEYRNTIRKKHLCNEFELIKCLKKDAAISSDLRSNAKQRAMDTVREIREQATPGLMEVFLVEYGLSTDEGIALMCLAEALLRVPDNETIDALIEDKIEPSDWGQHLGHSHSTLVNASTWALMLTGKVLEDGDGVSGVLKGAVKRMGEPVIRAAVSRAMKELGAQFVLGQTIEEAIERGQSQMRKGFTYSFDMLGEAAMTAADADDYFQDYARAIQFLAGHAVSDDIRKNPGISIKLSALHPRYEPRQRKRVLSELVGKVLHLAIAAKNARMGLNIDAEESERLEISLDVFEAVLSDPELASWDGFGFVVQAYSKRALPVLEWLYAQAEHFDRKLMVRLVKGAYWDSEVKRAQVEGLNGFPVFTAKANTDVSYLCCANRLGKMTDRIYPQFATHNAHTVSAILEMGIDPELYEFQSLHGMGEALHSILREKHGVGSRIYAPVGAHRDLLAYLVRRLLENGANSSFVNQIINEAIPLDEVAADPFSEISEGSPVVQLPSALYEPERINSKGLDLDNPVDLQILEQAREPFKNHQWQAEPLTATKSTSKKPAVWEVINPADMQDKVGAVTLASDEDTEAAINAAQNWESASAEKRGEILNTAADLYEENFAELFGVITREAGKTQNDCIAELREAVDFLRYYAARAQKLEQPARGIFCCISPWNFPLAIFTGQIAAALAAGNGVIAKPAEATSLTAFVAVNLLHKAGVPRTVLQLLPGEGGKIGRLLTSDRRINGVCFTGSTATAQQINRAMAGSLHPNAPLIAETGGLNAMIVDSTALPEQAVRDIVVSAFQSAGQRCSALRVL
ncbi:MAG: bifunctional proline dehydrogenase/L-glutamate gamma-semialdehyde dehydrogenase PutA, partial [Pseudomonadota bacterium]